MTTRRILSVELGGDPRESLSGRRVRNSTLAGIARATELVWSNLGGIPAGAARRCGEVLGLPHPVDGFRCPRT